MSCRSQTPEKLPVFPLIIETFAFTSVLQPNAGIKIPGRDSIGQLISKLRAMLRVPGPSSFNAALPYRFDSRAVPALTPVLAGSGASSFRAISDLTPVLLVGTDFARAVAAIPAQCYLFLFTVSLPSFSSCFTPFLYSLVSFFVFLFCFFYLFPFRLSQWFRSFVSRLCFSPLYNKYMGLARVHLVFNLIFLYNCNTKSNFL